MLDDSARIRHIDDAEVRLGHERPFSSCFTTSPVYLRLRKDSHRRFGAVFITLPAGAASGGLGRVTFFADGIGPGSRAVLVCRVSMADESGPHVKSGLVIFGKEDGRPIKSALPSKAEGPASEVYRIKDDLGAAFGCLGTATGT
jgi:hypothetical protein